MPKSKSPAELSPEDADAVLMSGYPEDGQEFDENAVVDDPVEDDQPAPEDDPVAKQLAELNARNEALSQQLAELRQRTAPVSQPTPQTVDWEKELFENPSQAVEKLRESIRAELRQEYSQDMGRREFWQRFYRAHPDLEESHDLVQAVLNANFAQLANRPIPEAITALAALTRQRIATYIQVQGRNKNRTNRARVEGGGPAPQQRPAPQNVPTQRKTLSDIIRKRREAKVA